jgi:hypothetical protein
MNDQLYSSRHKEKKNYQPVIMTGNISAAAVAGWKDGWMAIGLMDNLRFHWSTNTTRQL